MTDILTRTLPANGVAPARAYATLRAQTPERSSFLIEAGSGGSGRGRYSILGYRTRAESLYPGGGNALAMLADDLKGGEPGQSFPAIVAQALVGYIAYDAVHPLYGIEPWADETDLSRMTRGSTAVIFDSLEGTMTIAGFSKGAVDRCEWELTNGPAIADLPELDPNAEAMHFDAQLDDAVFATKAARARKYIAEGAVSRLSLARLFKAPFRGSDPFDVYRALCVLDPAPYHFFLEYAEVPMAEGIAIAGSAEAGELLGLTSIDLAPLDALRAAIPGRAKLGEPAERAAAIIRELEPSSRGMFGGSVGYFSPTGVLELAQVTTAVVARRGFFESRSAVDLTAESEAGTEVALVRRAAQPALAAIRAAQNIAAAKQ